MEIVNRIVRMTSISAKILSGDMKIGLVCTMGAIHPGHVSLIQAARKMADLVVVSIFVNRLQFQTDKAFAEYPRDIMKDVDLLRPEGVDYVFTPVEKEMYPDDFSSFVQVDRFGEKLPGLDRNSLFRGMTTSYLKMINIVRPSFVFLGQKDGIQGAILRKMVRDLNIGTEVVVTPVVRDALGLAYAAHNFFLDEEEQQAASVIFRSLQAADKAVGAGETSTKRLIAEIRNVISSEPLAAFEYAVIADPDTLEPVSKIQRSALIGVGARIGAATLNDSLLVEPAAK